MKEVLKNIVFPIRAYSMTVRRDTTRVSVVSSFTGDLSLADAVIKRFVVKTNVDELDTNGYAVVDRSGRMVDTVLVWHAVWEHGSGSKPPQLVETSKN